MSVTSGNKILIYGSYKGGRTVIETTTHAVRTVSTFFPTSANQKWDNFSYYFNRLKTRNLKLSHITVHLYWI